jgi:hypothetical protein
VSWQLSGQYFESCNCDAICPCRTIGGRPGGRSTHGICFGILSWLIEHGEAGDVDLSGSAAALEFRYDDDEPGSPWRFVLHVDTGGDERRRDGLAQILLGRLGGDHVLGLPWVRKPSELLDVRESAIEIRPGLDVHELRIGEAVTLRASRPVETDETVSCIVPGHHQPGRELYAERLAVHDAPFEWELEGNCAFVSAFSYSSG